MGATPKSAADVVKPGDVVLVEPAGNDPKGTSFVRAAQIPEVSGAIVAIDPHTGRVLAMSGGFSYGMSQFDRATQAKRQPGSAFKPFVYLAALDNGMTPSTLVLDAPFVDRSGSRHAEMAAGQFQHDDYLGAVAAARRRSRSRSIR